ncbi:MAG: hypothetical protein WD276_07345 [Actinomycetota bacterium]
MSAPIWAVERTAKTNDEVRKVLDEAETWLEKHPADLKVSSGVEILVMAEGSNES